jgi:hypothetical protein
LCQPSTKHSHTDVDQGRHALHSPCVAMASLLTLPLHWSGLLQPIQLCRNVIAPRVVRRSGVVGHARVGPQSGHGCTNFDNYHHASSLSFPQQPLKTVCVTTTDTCTASAAMWWCAGGWPTRLHPGKCGTHAFPSDACMRLCGGAGSCRSCGCEMPAATPAHHCRHPRTVRAPCSGGCDAASTQVWTV